MSPYIKWPCNLSQRLLLLICNYCPFVNKDITLCVSLSLSMRVHCVASHLPCAGFLLRTEHCVIPLPHRRPPTPNNAHVPPPLDPELLNWGCWQGQCWCCCPRFLGLGNMKFLVEFKILVSHQTTCVITSLMVGDSLRLSNIFFTSLWRPQQNWLMRTSLS